MQQNVTECKTRFFLQICENLVKNIVIWNDLQEKYQYLIEKAKENDSFPLELRLDNFKVNGCQSQVWLVPEEKDEKLFLPFFVRSLD